MATHAFAHFACHGAIDPHTPGESGLCLADGRLSIEELARRDLPLHALQFAFLSACHTGAASTTLLDEAITTGAAMQLAGFRHVIATLWAINDRRSAEIARDVYKAMKDDQGRNQFSARQIADALHLAVHKQRDAGRPAREWAAFTHIGA
jgi:CHAT domain-containing protein